MDSADQTNQQSFAPSAVITTQPLTHTGLPPESPFGFTPKNGSKKWQIIVVLVALVLVVVGIYALVMIYGTKN